MNSSLFLEEKKNEGLLVFQLGTVGLGVSICLGKICFYAISYMFLVSWYRVQLFLFSFIPRIAVLLTFSVSIVI